MNITINNISLVSQGPFGLDSQITIAASNSYTITDGLLHDFVLDINLRLALEAGYLTLTVGASTLSDDIASAYLTSCCHIDLPPNMRTQILNASDLIETYTWADHGTAHARVTSITFTAASVTSMTLTKTFAYTSASGQYRLDSITWSLA